MAESLKVAVRVRPFNAREIDHNAELCIKMSENSTYISDIKASNEEPKKFTFDYSYWSHDGFKTQDNGYLSPANEQYADQKIVFQDLGEGVLTNAWKGYNCSLFAYGQTGSGKSYSIVGYGQNKGIVPIMCERLFEDIDKKKDEGSKTEFQVSLSMLEIYNEQVRDLLAPSTLKVKGGMRIRQHPKRGFIVDGLSSVPVGSYHDIESKISQGTINRTVASTNMNATSSRAHTIVAITFEQKYTNDAKQKVTKSSIINLVDLAGSERADSTGATGDRLKEGSAINQSLSCLGNVIKALADAAKAKDKGKIQVPFRDSVLTKLLKNALGGNSKTVMIAALSPAHINYEETLSTLRFADRAKAIKTKAVINESPTEKLIRELREENAALMAKLKAASGDPAAMAKLMAEQDGAEQQHGAEQDDDKKRFDEEEVEKMKKEMEEELKRREEEMEKMKESWEERLQKQSELSKAKEEELKNENLMKKTTAHLWNLNEDSQLTNMVTHFLQPGTYTIGNKKANPPANITFTGLSIQENHATICHDGETNIITLKPAARAKTIANGNQIVDVCELHHGDRLLFGNNHLFILHHPKDTDLLQKQDEARKEGKVYEETLTTFEKAQEEIAKNSGLLNSGMFDFSKLSGADKKEFQMDMLLREDLLRLLPMISEANAMSEELDKKVLFEPVLISPQSRGEKDGRTEVNVKMKDLLTENEWIWEKNKFVNRKYLMQEMYQNSVEGEDWELSQDRDPFWEPSDMVVLIGTVHLFLQSLAFKIELQETLSITDFRGNEQGALDCEMIPCTLTGDKLDEDDFVEDPVELIGGCLNCKLKITGARGLPRKFAKGESFCMYKMYLEETATTTKSVKNTINPDYLHEEIFTFNPVTNLFVDYLLHSPLIIEVWGRQSDEKSSGHRKSLASHVSTKQLMNQDRVNNPRFNNGSDGFNEEERYRLLCDTNVYKRRAERFQKKMRRIQVLVNKAKEDKKKYIKISDIEKALRTNEPQRFHAAADVVLHGEKLARETEENDGNIPTSAACVLQ